MEIVISETKQEFGEKAAQMGAELIRKAIHDNGKANILAFNDPLADFEMEETYLVVTLDKEYRLQQMGEGWFPTIDDVPKQAISMSIKQIMKSKAIICCVPEFTEGRGC